LDGFGVVCGLQMRCDCHCKGHITIGDGYAIDCCGNDLVVCEPRSFDVIGELRKKNWLVEMRGDQRNKHEHVQSSIDCEGETEDECIIKQCFYIGICYAEEPAEFVTPYTTECQPAPGPCQPTRILERVRFEVYDKVPVRPNPLEEIGKRIERCFKLFREGQFSRGLESLAPRILRVLTCEPGGDSPDTRVENPERHKEACCLFKELQAQFLHELRTCPDQYNCDLEHEVCRLHPPCREDLAGGPAPHEAFTRLFELIQKYVFSCVLAQLAFSCPEPPDPCCVLVGSVEIQNGCLRRVINFPRWYLWCFANFFEVLAYTLANDAACGKKEVLPPGKAREELPKPVTNGCCPGFEVDVCKFLSLFSTDNRAFQMAARASVDSIQAMYRALAEGFNFTRPGGIVPAVVRNLNLEKARDLAKTFGIDFRRLTTQEAGQHDVFGALADNRIHFSSDALVYDVEEKDDTVTRVNGVMGAPAFAVGNYTYTIISDLMDRHTRTEERLSRCESELAALKAKPKAPGQPEVPPAGPQR